MAKKIIDEYYICKDCGEKYFDPICIHTSYESMYGVTGLFNNTTPYEYDACPFCRSDNIEWYEEEEDDEDEEEE